MAFKQPGSGESFPTCVTLVVEAVCEHVHAQGGHAHIHLATNSTLLGRAGGEAEVGLLVSVGIELLNKATPRLKLIHLDKLLLVA